MVDPALGVAVGWNHFVRLHDPLAMVPKLTLEQFAQTSYVIFEATVINTLVGYWGYDQSPAILITVSLLFYLGINVYRADLFGEAECESGVSQPFLTETDEAHATRNSRSLVGAGQDPSGHRSHLVHLRHHGRRKPPTRVRLSHPPTSPRY